MKKVYLIFETFLIIGVGLLAHSMTLGLYTETNPMSNYSLVQIYLPSFACASVVVAITRGSLPKIRKPQNAFIYMCGYFMFRMWLYGLFCFITVPYRIFKNIKYVAS